MTGSTTSSFAQRVRDAALGVEGVAGLNAGVLREISTYLPGDRVPGVRMAGDGVHVHIVIEATAVEHIPEVARRTHHAVRRLVEDAADLPDAPASAVEVHVHVDDVEEQLPAVQEYPDTGTRKDES